MSAGQGLRVRAPGKLLVTGAYAVLEGAPAIVCAIDRHASVAVDSAYGPADTRALYDGSAKLGLGSSAALAVARLGAAACGRGEALDDPRVRESIFQEARAAHAREQSGGSGVDVAASTFGGVLRYTLGQDGAPPAHSPLGWPSGLFFDAYWSGTSARTSDLRARVTRLGVRHAGAYRARMTELADTAVAGATAAARGDAEGLIGAARATLRALGALGVDADAPIVPRAFGELAGVAEAHGAAFLPSGAGGGDVGIYLGPSAPPPEVQKRASELGLRPLGLSLDPKGLRLDPSSSK